MKFRLSIFIYAIAFPFDTIFTSLTNSDKITTMKIKVRMKFYYSTYL